MEELNALFGGFAVALTWQNVMFMFIGTILGVLIGVLAPLSDLVESLLKRNVQVKDSGEVPGLGGILDVLDSLLLTVPVVYFYLAHVMGLS